MSALRIPIWKPTALANGHLAAVSRPSSAKLSVLTFATFYFPGRYHARQAIRLTEDRARLRSVLAADDMRRAWRWAFGDGTSASGWTVAHRYAHPGTYRIDVEAYSPYLHAYFAFDTVRIVVVR